MLVILLQRYKKKYQNDNLIPNGNIRVNGCSVHHVFIPSELWK